MKLVATGLLASALLVSAVSFGQTATTPAPTDAAAATTTTDSAKADAHHDKHAKKAKHAAKSKEAAPSTTSAPADATTAPAGK